MLEHRENFSQKVTSGNGIHVPQLVCVYVLDLYQIRKQNVTILKYADDTVIIGNSAAYADS